MEESGVPVEFSTCGHTSKIENYCEKCKIFSCDVCSKSHMEHLKFMRSWENTAKEYLMKCKDAHTIAKLLLKNTFNPDSLKAEVFAKVDEWFTVIYTKIESFKQKIQEEIWREVFGGGQLENEEVKTNTDFERRFGELSRAISDLKSHKKGGDKVSMINCMRENVLQSVFADIQVYTEAREHTAAYERGVKSLKITDHLNFDDFRKKITVSSAITQNMQLQKKYAFPDGSPLWRKKVGNQYMTLCCPTVLPPFFKASIRINIYTGSHFGTFGVCKQDFQEEKGKGFPWLSNQWGCSPEHGTVMRGNEGHISGNKAGMKKGDIVSIVYDRAHNLYFEINRERQPNGFKDLQGPFYLWATIYYAGSEIEIIEVIPL